MFKITSTRDLALQQGVKALVYGRAGAGKTYMARTAPNPLFVSSEAGVLALRDVEMPAIAIHTIQELREVHAWLKSSAEAKDFWTVYIDSISEIAEVILSNAKTLTKDPRQAYGQLLEDTISTLRDYRDLPMRHVVMVAKQEHRQDEVTKITAYGPSMPGGKLGNAIPYMFDEVFRLGIGRTVEGQEYRFLQTSPDIQYEAKDRSGVLDPVEPPDIGRIINKILGIK